MNTRTFTAEAETLELARNDMKAKIPAGFFIQSEQILSDGKTQVSRGVAETYESALAGAKKNLPGGFTVVETREVQTAETRKVTISAEDEEAAKKMVNGMIDKTDIVKSIKLSVKGKKGFLGIGKVLDQFEATIRRQSIVEISHKKKASIKVTVCDEVSSWETLICSVEQAGSSLTTGGLYEQFPYHILFLVLSNKLNQPDYFKNIPFHPITPEIIDQARRYVENPRMPMLMSAFGETLDPERYVIKSGGLVYRKANLMVDSAITSVADYLRGHGNVSFNEPEKISRFAYDAIVHYAGLPPVAFFFTLPYLQTVVESKNIVIEEVLASQYKGTEGLLIELYDALNEGGLITDRMVQEKVKSMLVS